MKKILSLLIFRFCTVSVFAQSEEEDDGFNIPNGIRFGYQNSNLTNEDEDSTDELDRFYLGYVRKVSVAHFIKIETGLEYMMAGAKLPGDAELQLHYIVLPAEGVFKLGPFLAEAGISANFRVAEKYLVNGEKTDRDDKSSAFDIPLNVGLGFNIAFLAIEARHYWGLLEVEEGWYNQYWQAGLKFHL